ncbi:MAG: hypothetical protein RR386_06150 [Bacteroidaceae bacterium]
MNNQDTIPLSFTEKAQASALRIYWLMKRDIVENGRAYTLASLAVYAILLFTFIYNIYEYSETTIRIGKGAEDMMSISSLYNAVMPLVTISCVAMFYFAAIGTFIMKNKGENITMLSLPATCGEKIVASFMVRFVAQLMLLYLALNLADITRLLYQPEGTESLHHLIIHRQFVDFFSSMAESRSIDAINAAKAISVIAGLLLLQSFCFLGSILWNNRTKIKTSILFVLLTVSGIKLLKFAFETIDTKVYSVNGFRVYDPVRDNNIATQLWILASVILALTLMNYVLTYYLCKRKSLKERKLLWII